MMHCERYRRELTLCSMNLIVFILMSTVIISAAAVDERYERYDHELLIVFMAPAVTAIAISCVSVISQVFILLTSQCV